MTNIKVCILGDGGVGKTEYIRRLKNGTFIRKYNPTMGVEVTRLRLTGFDDIEFNIWDCAGQEKYGAGTEKYLENASFVLVCFDMTSKTSYKNVPFWVKKAGDVSPYTPVVVCGLKSESPDAHVFPLKQNHKTFIRVSTKDNIYDLLVRPFHIGKILSDYKKN
jgi:GTP-binding nuclear protein Ran